MDASSDSEGIESETCVWIKEESELDVDGDTVDPISCVSTDPLCELAFSSAPEEDSDPANEENTSDNAAEDTMKKECLISPLQPIVDLGSKDDDPELNLDEITAKTELIGEYVDSSERVGDMPFQCPECYFSCFQQANYLKHMRIHVSEKTHVCPACNKSFFFRNSFLRHLSIHQHEEVYETMVVNVGENLISALAANDRTGIRGGGILGGSGYCRLNSFTCVACNATFISREQLLGHIRRHSVGEPYACLVCDQKFERKVLLLRHEKTHADDMPFACQECEIRFSDKFTLAQHAIVHTYEKSFVCHVCNRRFWQQERLDEHMRTFHDDKKRFECDVCHYKFARSQDVGRHMRTHQPPSLLECPLCTFSVKSHRVLARHANAHIKERANTRQYVCPLCQRKLVGNYKIISHMQNHAKEKW